jgi:hypothetical protein
MRILPLSFFFLKRINNKHTNTPRLLLLFQILNQFSKDLSTNALTNTTTQRDGIEEAHYLFGLRFQPWTLMETARILFLWSDFVLDLFQFPFITVVFFFDSVSKAVGFAVNLRFVTVTE